MVTEAGLINKGNGRFGYDEPTSTPAATLAEWLEDVAGGLTVTPAPEIEPRVDELNGGRVFRVTNAGAAPGHKTNYIIAWEARDTLRETEAPAAPYRPPVIDRLATPEGVAHARAVLARLGEMDSDEDGIDPDTIEPVRFRRWDVETGEPIEDDA